MLQKGVGKVGFNSIQFTCFHLSRNTKKNTMTRMILHDKCERCGCHQRTYSVWLMTPTRLQENDYLGKVKVSPIAGWPSGQWMLGICQWARVVKGGAHLLSLSFHRLNFRQLWRESGTRLLLGEQREFSAHLTEDDFDPRTFRTARECPNHNTTAPLDSIKLWLKSNGSFHRLSIRLEQCLKSKRFIC